MSGGWVQGRDCGHVGGPVQGARLARFAYAPVPLELLTSSGYASAMIYLLRYEPHSVCADRFPIPLSARAFYAFCILSGIYGTGVGAHA